MDSDAELNKHLHHSMRCSVCGCLGLDSSLSCDCFISDQDQNSGKSELTLNSAGKIQESNESNSSRKSSFHIGEGEGGVLSNEDSANEYDNDSTVEDKAVIQSSGDAEGSLKIEVVDESNNKTEESEDTDDEQVRSRTPLLARHNSSLEQKSQSSGSFSSHHHQNSGLKKDAEGSRSVGGASVGPSHCKRVSFSTRSLDGSQHYYHQHNHKGRHKQYDISKDRDNRHGRERKRKNRRSSDTKLSSNSVDSADEASEVDRCGERCVNDTSNNSMGSYCGVSGNDVASTSVSAPNIDEDSESSPIEKRFALVPQRDSLIGGNLAGGPFPSQWLFQAVNVAVKAIASSMTNNGSKFSLSAHYKYNNIMKLCK